MICQKGGGAKEDASIAIWGRDLETRFIRQLIHMTQRFCLEMERPCLRYTKNWTARLYLDVSHWDLTLPISCVHVWTGHGVGWNSGSDICLEQVFGTFG